MKKGFTLIELLAVIVILAIIALIATPVILNIIEDSKISSGERSVELYLDGLKKQIAAKNMSKEFNPKHCVIENKVLVCDNEEIEVSENCHPEDGEIYLDNGNIIYYNLLINGTYYSNGELLDSCYEFNSETQTITSYGNLLTKEGEIVRGTCDKDVNIPRSIDEISVRAIGNRAFREKGITSVYIPSSVTTIGSAAFADNKISNVLLFHTINQIDRYAFGGNPLVSVEIQREVGSNCSSLINNNQFGDFDRIECKSVYTQDPYKPIS